jgi:(1->4)-alpha-D-glucan 1-alpha-D-glucosylmutase
LNDVGGDPDRFGVDVDEFHAFIQRRKKRWPHAMNTTATHDTKRGEDARARICVLSELAEEWDECLKSWSKMNRAWKIKIKGQEAPDRNDEYFLYQTLIGCYPVGETDGDLLNRLGEYLVKAVREAKVHTEWLKPDLAYEEAFTQFAAALLAPAQENRFLSEFVPFAQKIAHCGMYNSLGQTLLKFAVPGVADCYQGTELWDLSLVDPDNRRPVNFAKRLEVLEALKSAEAEDRPALLRELLQHWQDGRIKFYLTYKLANVRRLHSEVLVEGDYVPLESSGELSDRVCAFARRSGAAWAVALAPRLIGAAVFNGAAPLDADFWRSTAVYLPKEAPSRWVNTLTGGAVDALLIGDKKFLPVQTVCKDFPVALLSNIGMTDEPILSEVRSSASSVEHAR